MRESLRYGFILGSICAIAAGLLAVVQALTGPKILQAAQAESRAALKEVMSQAEKFVPVEKGKETLYYRAFDRQGQLVGFVFKAAGKGYSSVIETMVGAFPDGKICAIKVISLNETPGLGMRVAEKEFTSRFAGKKADEVSGIKAIAGVTISSKAVIDSVQRKAQEIKDMDDGR